MVYDSILQFFKDSQKPNHRYKSWEHCYNYFSGAPLNDPEKACLHLDSYLASWGMKRGSTQLLEKDYKVHEEIVSLITDERYNNLRGLSIEDSRSRAGLLFELIEKTRACYQKLLSDGGNYRPSDTLVTKVLLGTLGCIPAYDRFLIMGLRKKDVPYSHVSERHFEALIGFCENEVDILAKAQGKINSEIKGQPYPIMKVVDMYFWTVGQQA